LARPVVPRTRMTKTVLWVAVLLLFLSLRFASVFTESINWDEFVMLARAERTLQLGEVVGGGRPGLVTIVLIPFLRHCVDTITAAVRARMLWQVIDLAYLVGLFVLLRQWFRFSRRPETGTFEGATAVALLAFLPSFVAWSVQVRSDQAALAAALWGGVCLLSERRRLAVVSGMLFGVALLFTQKGIYAMSLCGLLWTAAVSARVRDTSPIQRNAELIARAQQVLTIAFCAALVLALYAYIVPSSTSVVGRGVVASSWQEMRWVRSIVGFRAYARESVHAPLHVFLFALLAISSIRALHVRTFSDLHLLGTCWAAVLLGLAVIIFHGSGYPYFVMTAGLFPAVALGMASGQFLELLGRTRQIVIALALITLAVGTVPITVEMLNGSQVDQRDTINWIEKSGLTAYSGYQVDGALLCQTDPDPVPPMLPFQIKTLAEQGESAFDEFLDKFRRKPVAYVVNADRLLLFPTNVRAFLADHYRWYYGSVSIAGFEIAPNSNSGTIDVIVPGTYHWLPMPRKSAAALLVDDTELPPDGRVILSVGIHNVATRPVDARGNLVLALRGRPGTENYSFVDLRQLERLYSAE
jgi:hypothetical protein